MISLYIHIGMNDINTVTHNPLETVIAFIVGLVA